MTTEITAKEAEDYVSKKLLGCSIEKISYSVTHWELRLIKPDSNEYLMYAAEIRIPHSDSWWNVAQDFPINIRHTNEPEDTISAIHIFTVLNKWPISEVEVKVNGNLNIGFENGVKLIFSEPTDSVYIGWSLTSIETQEVITCDSCSLYISAN